jgi:pimeloyl-ACP methyl ester carboxylesterase
VIAVRRFIALAVVGGLALAVVPARAEEPVAIPVSFDVVNTNTSKVPCPTDGKPYTVEGDLVGLPSDLAASERAVTLYLHGSTISRFQWRMPVPGYDYAWEMAKLGHVSLAIDQLGYEASGHPDGNAMCVGGLADIAHQIVGKLGSGDYRANGAQGGPTFQKIAIAGNSMGGVVAEIETYSYDDVDGLILFGAGDLTVSIVLALPRARDFAVKCAQGGEPPEDGWTEPLGYAYTWPSAEAELDDVAYEIDPAVAAAFAEIRNRDSCENQGSVAEGLAFNNLYSWQIDVPVLLMYGEHEKLFGPQPWAGEIQKAKMIGSDDVTLVVNENEGHVGMLEVHADVFRARVSAWLTPRGF